MILTTNTNIVSTENTNTADAVKVSFPKTVTGPTTIVSGQDAVFKLTEYKYVENKVEIIEPTEGQMVGFDLDKEEIGWVIWVESGLMNETTDHLHIVERGLIDENETDIYNEKEKVRFISLVASNGYLSASMETVIEEGVKINQLTMKFSKWLDGKNVYIEAFRNTPDHNTSLGWVKTSIINAPAEITKAFWLSDLSSKITNTKFNSTIYLYIESLGLENETINLNLKDYDTDTDVLWDGTILKAEQITERKQLVAYELGPSTEYGDIIIEESNSIKLKAIITYGSTIIQPTNIVEYTKIEVSDVTLANIFFAKKSILNYDDIDYPQYDEVSRILPGMEVYIVAETSNISGQVTFSVTEQESLLVGDGENLPLLEGAVEKTEFTGAIEEDQVAIKVKFQELDSDKYNTWNGLLMPEGDALVDSTVLLKMVTSDDTEYNAVENPKIEAPFITQHIYHDGTISKENYVEGLIKKVKFLYHTSATTENERNIGVFDTKWAQKWKDGSRHYHNGWKKIISGGKTRYYEYDGPAGEKKAPLVSIFTDVVSGTNSRKYIEHVHDSDTIFRLSEDTSREYFNPERCAALIGAIIDWRDSVEWGEVENIDIVTNGSVGLDGSGAWSVTHYNGNNIDFKYLRDDKQRPRIDISEGVIYADDQSLDLVRQNLFLDSLHKFGYARTKKCLSYFLYDHDEGKVGKDLLNHCSEHSGHNDHLHIQGFIPRYNN